MVFCVPAGSIGTELTVEAAYWINRSQGRRISVLDLVADVVHKSAGVRVLDSHTGRYVCVYSRFVLVCQCHQTFTLMPGA